MVENNGHSNLIGNGEGRLFTNSYTDGIDKEEFEKVVNAPKAGHGSTEEKGASSSPAK